MGKKVQPVVFVSHGPGPMWCLDSPIAPPEINKHSKGAKYIKEIFNKLYKNNDELPKKILIISAHWISEITPNEYQITKNDKHTLIYDYYGFEKEAYDLKYDVKGDKLFAERVSKLLNDNKLKTKLVDRGLDHGVFIPMILMRPEADIPIVELSLGLNLDSKEHYNLGKVLSVLRNEDVLIICSGHATHNLRLARRITSEIPEKWALEFQNWLDNTIMYEGNNEKHINDLLLWEEKAPNVQLAHPTTDHFIPLLVAVGAANGKPAKKLHDGFYSNFSIASYYWE